MQGHGFGFAALTQPTFSCSYFPSPWRGCRRIFHELSLSSLIAEAIGLAVDLGIDAAIGLDLLAHRTTHRANNLFNPFTALVAVRARAWRGAPSLNAP